MIQIRTITSNHPDYPGVVALRDAVLRRPLGLSIYNDDLSKDEDALILIAEEENEIIGCVLLQPQAGSKAFRLRAMAVTESRRGTGVGRKLIAAAEKAAAASGAPSVILHARQVVLPFYEKLGYTATGGPFTEVGIPHLLMQKTLTA